MIPQLLIIALVVFALGYIFSKHGEDRLGTTNAWYPFIRVVILFVILYYGGFWDVLL